MKQKTVQAMHPHSGKKGGAQQGGKPACGMPYHTQHRSGQGRKHGFKRSLLPDHFDFYLQELPALKGRGAWLLAVCPFHDDRHPSLSANIASGGFICHACGVRGGSIIDFYMQLYGLDFVSAAKALGAWV